MHKASCGPWWLRKSIRIELSTHFESTCARHDALYQSATLSRKDIDEIFLIDMLHLAGKDKRLQRYAYVYYYSVRLGGWLSYGRKG